MKVLGSRVLVRQITEEEKKGSIIIAEAYREKPCKGVVIAVGRGLLTDPGVWIPLDVNVGDTVMFSRHAGADVNVDGEDLLVMNEKEILVVL